MFLFFFFLILRLRVFQKIKLSCRHGMRKKAERFIPDRIDLRKSTGDYIRQTIKLK